MAQTSLRLEEIGESFSQQQVSVHCTVIPAMVQRLFSTLLSSATINMQHLPRESNFMFFLATALTGALTAGPLLKQIYGKGVAHLWKNEGVALLRELLYCFRLRLYRIT